MVQQVDEENLVDKQHSAAANVSVTVQRNLNFAQKTVARRPVDAE